MLSDTQRVVIPARQVGLQIFFYVMINVKILAKINHPMGVIRPIGCFCHPNVVDPSDFVKIYKIVRLSHDFKRCVYIKRWLKADPSKNPTIMEFFQGFDSVVRKCRASFPFQAKRVVEARQRGSECVAVSPKKVNIAQGAIPPFRERAERKPTLTKRLKRLAGECCVCGMVWISRKAEHHLIGDPSRLVFCSILFEACQKIGALCSAFIKIRSLHTQHVGDVAVGTFVPAATIRVSGQRGVFASLPCWGINVGAAFNRTIFNYHFYPYQSSLLFAMIFRFSVIEAIRFGSERASRSLFLVFLRLKFLCAQSLYAFLRVLSHLDYITRNQDVTNK